MKLHEIRDNDGAHKRRMRVGRGIGSGKGKTSGRGVKGQKARTGVSLHAFEGGQMPLFRRLPKRGFKPINPVKLAEVNLWQLQEAVDAGRLDPKQPVDGAALVAAKVIRRTRDGVRLLGEGELKAKLTLKLAGASTRAKAAVEAAGGSIELPKLREPAKKKGKKAVREAAARREAAAKKEAAAAEKPAADKPAKEKTAKEKPAAKKADA
ncbi:MAG: 50S ribosomal protein L15 [Alphaproteobacteria bacterium]|nr:50S ribosomal protein L15 [Alphaproteobacteria bacterium]